MTDSREEEYLAISGIQHYAFCQRQWALIHLEQQWAENLRTVDGHLLHRRAHDETKTESRGDTLIVRGLRVVSHQLGVQGVCDVVEFHRSSNGISLSGRDGLWQPYPIEYKKGKPNSYGADELQLCTQALCLEEMLLCKIPDGALFYAEPHRRVGISFDAALRQQVTAMLSEMLALFARGHTPKAKPSKSCNACSIKDLCLPGLVRAPAVSDYLRQHLLEEADTT